MSFRIRRALVALTGLGLLTAFGLRQTVDAQVKTAPAAAPATPAPALPGVPAGPEQPAPNNEFSHAMTLPTDNKLQKRLEGAQDIINENLKNPDKTESWGEVGRLLQGLLDAKEDVFVQVKRKDAAGKEAVHWVSVRAEANRLLGTMPSQGREFYELKYGPPVRTRLEDAKATGNPEILADVARRYLHTKAGSEATNLLGTYHLDRGQYVPAALCFERLVNRDGVEKLSTPTLVKATLSFHRTGDKVNAEKTWRQLSERSAREGLRLADQTVTLPELQKVLEKYNQPLRELFSPSDWPMFRGTANRTAQGIGGPPFMEKKWEPAKDEFKHLKLIAQLDTQRWVEQAIKGLERNHQPVLPSFFPIAVGGKLVYRTYSGVTAIDLKTGELWWNQPSKGSLDKMAADSQQAVLTQWLGFYQQANPSFIFENSTLGTLSTDNSRVYVVEDLALPPHPQYLQNFNQGGWGGNGMQANFGTLSDLVHHSKLQAIDLETGKMLWELGGRDANAAPADKKDAAGEKKIDAASLNDSFFLGPPLPLGGKLYVLTEKFQELRLICLDPAKDPIKENPIVWSQTLAATRDKMLQDVGRRIRAAPLAYGDGIIVCPTNAGAVLGVDLLSHSLVWAYAYREKDQQNTTEDEQQALMRGRRGMGMGMQAVIPLKNDEWKPAAPVIQDGKVVFTAPDGSKVFCLNLRDGSLLWNAERKDDLYLGGVYNGKVLLVGKNACRALNLADGKQLWTVETGLPSGQGIASDNIYYLPLQTAAQTKQPEVCAIDLEKGSVLAHTRARTRMVDNKPVAEIPGNLLFYEGDVVSQTATDLTVYPQLKVKVRQMDELIAKNPNDPVGLTERGELRLDQGDVTGAVEDLRLALANNPPPDLVPKTRNRLYETMTEALRRNFIANEKYLDDYKKLCEDVPADAKMSGDERLKEKQRRQGNYLCLVAKGREEQGRLSEAWKAYMDFGAQAPKDQKISSIDEPTVQADPQVWAQGRIAAMMAKATDEQRKPLEKEMAEKWGEIKSSNDLVQMRKFVGAFGTLFRIGKEARLQLAERLIEDSSPANQLEIEQNLQMLRLSSEPEVAARAVEALARLATRNNQLDDAYSYYEILGRDYAKVVIRDGKTGADFFNDMATDKRFLQYTDGPRARTGGKLQAKVERGSYQMTRQLFTFESEGEVLPFFQRHRLAYDTQMFKFKLFDRAMTFDRANTSENQPLWETVVSKNQLFASYLGYLGNPGSTMRFPYQTVGHLVVLNLGQTVYGIDPINQKVLWDKNLLDTSSLPQGQQPTYTLDADGSLLVAYPDNWVQRVGQRLPVEPSYVCLQTRDGLLVIDPLTGRTLWTRSSVSMRTHVFGNGDYLYLVELNSEGQATDAKALRASDGVALKVPDFAPLYKQRVRTLGGQLLLSETDAQGILVVRLYDINSGKDLWKQSFPAGSVVLRSEVPHLAGAIEPNGTATVVDLRTQKVVLRAIVHPEALEKVQSVTVLEDSKTFYLAFNGPSTDASITGPYSNLLPVSGMRGLTLNGRLYAYERTSGKLRWYHDAPHQMIVLDQFDELPVVLLTARYQKANGPGGSRFQQAAVRGLDKRTGKLLLDEDGNLGQFYALHVDQRAGRYELVGLTMRVIVGYLDSTASASAAWSQDVGTQPLPRAVSIAQPQLVPALQIRAVGVGIPAPPPPPPPPPRPAPPAKK